MSTDESSLIARLREFNQNWTVADAQLYIPLAIDEIESLRVQLKLSQAWQRPANMADCDQFCKTAVRMNAERESLRAALAELVACKRLKDRIDAADSWEREESRAHFDRVTAYTIRAPAAWAAAFALVDGETK